MTHIQKSFKKYSCTRQFGRDLHTHLPIPLSFLLITGWYSDYKNQYTKVQQGTNSLLEQVWRSKSPWPIQASWTPRGRRKQDKDTVTTVNKTPLQREKGTGSHGSMWQVQGRDTVVHKTGVQGRESVFTSARGNMDTLTKKVALELNLKDHEYFGVIF